MTIRTRLGLGFVAVAVVLVLPLLLALRALDRFRDQAVALRNNEFAASLLLGRIRGGTHDLRQAETALIFVPSDTTRDTMSARIARLQELADSLSHYQLDSAARHVHDAIHEVAMLAPVEFRDALAGRIDAADSTSTHRVQPAITRIETWTTIAEQSLRLRTRDRVDDAVNAGAAARYTAWVALAAATLLAALIAVGLTRSVSRPVRDLERGMAAVAGGDFDHRLSITPQRGDEFGRLALSFQMMARQLAELDKLKAEFVSVASHELKTPINVVLGYLQLFDEGVYGQLTPKQREILRTLEGQTQALARLVKQLLDVSRFEAGSGRVDPHPMALEPFLGELEQAFDVLARQRGVTFRILRDDDLPTEVSWDADRMSEVMGNLLSNAFKFTDRDGTVELRASTVGDAVQIAVRDTGAGIPRDQLPYIFEKFFQATNQERAADEGTGLGLAIAKQIIEAHGGTVTVDSRQGTGTTFTVTLPQVARAIRELPRSDGALAGAGR
jgi:signal transduction histidine kinase